LPIVTQTGVSKWIVINAKTAFSDGKCIRLFGALRDITNDKEMRRSLIESREQYKGIIDNSSDIIYELDSNGYYQFVSKVWHQLLGHSIEEVVGKHFSYFIHQDDMETFQHYLNDLIGGKEAEQMVEYRMMHKNGHYEWYESSCSTTKRNGELYVLGIGREITQIKADQNNLRALNEQLIHNAEKLIESEKNYSDLFLLSPQPMFIYDLETYQFIKVNHAALVQYEYNEAEFLELNLFDINHKDEQSGLASFLKQKSTIEEKYALRSKHIKKSGEVIDVDVYSSMLVQQTNTYRIVLVIDVTKQLKRIQEIEKQNGLLKDIAWIQSHVVRAPLSNIMGLINILNSPMNKKENEADIFFKILDEAKKLDTIVRDIAEKANEAEVEINSLGLDYDI
jgi:PAS domain S-box-containing protein